MTSEEFNELRPLPKCNPRVNIVEKAKNIFWEKILDIVTQYHLTNSELFYILSDYMKFVSQQCISKERN